MKATGIVRRIDDLGRVVIPKEIRRTLRLREGTPLEIFTDREGEIIFKKYSPMAGARNLRRPVRRCSGGRLRSHGMYHGSGSGAGSLRRHEERGSSKRHQRGSVPPAVPERNTDCLARRRAFHPDSGRREPRNTSLRRSFRFCARAM